VVPVPIVEAPNELSVELHADLRFVGVVERLDTIDSRVPAQDPTVFFALPFATIGAQAGLGPHVNATAAMRFNQVSQASLWQAQLWDAMVNVTCGEVGHFRFGLMPSYFGLDELMTLSVIDMGGVDQYAPLGWASGFNPERGLGIGWTQNLGTKTSADFQLLNALADESGDLQSEKTASIRVSVALVEGLEFLVSGRTGLLGEEALALGDSDLGVGVISRFEDLRLIGEMFKSLDESGHLAWSMSTAYGVDMGSGIPRKVDLLARVRGMDPNRNAGGDGLLQVAAGANLFFNTPAETAFSTGLLWEMDLPEDNSAAIEHELALQMRVHF
jgi:hypothetical protein